MTKVKYSAATWLKCKLMVAQVQRRIPLEKVAFYKFAQTHLPFQASKCCSDLQLGNHFLYSLQKTIHMLVQDHLQVVLHLRGSHG